MPRASIRVWAVVALAAAAAAGCGDRGPARCRVSGTVTLGGQPVPTGFVIFDPDPAKGNNGPQGYAPIRDGRFDTADGGEGAPAGAVVVQVRGLGPPAPGFSKGTPLHAPYSTSAEVHPDETALVLAVPAASRLKAPPGGFVAP